MRPDRRFSAQCLQLPANCNILSSGSCSRFQARIYPGGASEVAKRTPKLPGTELLQQITECFPGCALGGFGQDARRCRTCTCSAVMPPASCFDAGMCQAVKACLMISVLASSSTRCESRLDWHSKGLPYDIGIGTCTVILVLVSVIFMMYVPSS